MSAIFKVWVFILLCLPVFTYGQDEVVGDDGLTERERYLKQFMPKSAANEMVERAKAERAKAQQVSPNEGEASDPTDTEFAKSKLKMEQIQGLLKKVLGKNVQGGQADQQKILKALNNTEGDQAKVMEQASEALKNMKLPEGQKIDINKLQDLMKKSQNGQLDQLDSETVSDLTDSALSFFRSQSLPQVEEFLKAKFQGSPIGPILTKNPKFTTFVARVMRDKRALPGFIKSWVERKKVYIFLGFVIFTIVLAKLWKRFQLRRSSVTIGGEVRGFVMRTICMFAVRVAGFFAIFRTEMEPFVQIFKTTFL